jgi:hypothetical protein
MVAVQQVCLGLYAETTEQETHRVSKDTTVVCEGLSLSLHRAVILSWMLLTFYCWLHIIQIVIVCGHALL